MDNVVIRNEKEIRVKKGGRKRHVYVASPSRYHQQRVFAKENFSTKLNIRLNSNAATLLIRS